MIMINKKYCHPDLVYNLATLTLMRLIGVFIELTRVLFRLSKVLIRLTRMILSLTGVLFRLNSHVVTMLWLKISFLSNKDEDDVIA